MIDIFARPLGALLKLIFNFAMNIGLESVHISAYAVAIIITTIIFKLILLPLSLKQTNSMKKIQEIQPKLAELQKKYKNDPQTLQAKTMELYKENKVNPFGGCLPLLIQMPIIIAFFRVLQDPVQYVFKNEVLYNEISKVFLWIPNLELADPFLWGLPLIAAVTTFIQSKMMNVQQADAGNEQAQRTQKTMNYFFPIMIFWFSKSFPAGLALYWVMGNIFQIVQQYITNRSLVKVREETK